MWHGGVFVKPLENVLCSNSSKDGKKQGVAVSRLGTKPRKVIVFPNQLSSVCALVAQCFLPASISYTFSASYFTIVNGTVHPVAVLWCCLHHSACSPYFYI